MQDRAFNTRTEAADSTPAVSFFTGGSAASLLGPFRIHRAEAISERRGGTRSGARGLHPDALGEGQARRPDRGIRAAENNTSPQPRAAISVRRRARDAPPTLLRI